MSTPVPSPAARPTIRLRLGAQLARPTVEQLAYLLIAALAFVTRFWDLGSRTLHHDESLHTYFSWVYEQGNGYIHHPMMHGPALFHLDALAYLLLGSSDWASRVPAALFGVVLVLLPVLLRGDRFLGRWGALAASVFLLVSPSVLYFSRFIRHDIFAVTATVLWFVCFLRYVERPERRWIVLFLITGAFMLTTHEVTFVSAFILVTFVALAFAARVAPIVLATSGMALTAFGLLLVLFDRLGVPGPPPIPWENPTREAIATFTIRLLTHPITLAAIGIGLLWILWSWRLVARSKPAGQSWNDWLSQAAPPGSIARALGNAWSDRAGLAWGASIGLALFVTLYTSLFTNLGGLASGTFGALGYWLGQHGVQRGEQPWFYYLVMMPQYEPVAVLAFPIGVAAAVWGGLRTVLGGAPFPRRWQTGAFLVYWSALMLAVLSWAGEKMPWLVIHISVPMCLLAGLLAGQLLERLEDAWRIWRLSQRHVALALALLTVLLLAQWYLAMSWLTAGPYDSTTGVPLRTVRAGSAEWLRLAWIPLLVAVILLLATAVDRGWRPYGRTLALAWIAALMLFQVHAGWRVTYREGDVPRDMLIYVQTSPHVVQLTRDLERLSLELTGGMGLEVWYDSGTQWPMNWYLREFPNRRYFGTTISALPEHPPPIILYSLEYLRPETDTLLRGTYTAFDYPMRWWYPEETTYRAFAIAPELKTPSRQNLQTNEPPPYSLLDVLRSVWRSIATAREPEQQAKLFRLVTMRELPSPIGSYRFRVYVRNDLVPAFREARIDQPRLEAVLAVPPVPTGGETIR
ncbi:TIGR03663 family protein [Thermomicrobium sp. 4228-Ro]|uniref:flippase activity-associated protein Agl23 n=1 Tax=Thermomicrobium sp. 4228-Ro TaxID=2993937 RepID=UPI0022492CA3|nr:flippase activity-associated protein Agl23 [Thermomicrobium sp. 4228-Ro]MCX2727462.1 TIGR03663 family protein [Thermomicrobium sp. 4228-Ro]